MKGWSHFLSRVPMLLQRIYLYFIRSAAVCLILSLTRKIVIPGFDGMPIYDVAVFFFKGIFNGAITTRASSIAFKFFVALFPGIIFFFTLIPYIPIPHLQETLLSTLEGLIPGNAFSVISTTVEDVVSRQHGGLLSFGFVMALYFSMSGIMGVIGAFNATYHSIETRNLIMKFLISLALALILAGMLTVAVAAITIGTSVMNYLLAEGILQKTFTYYLIVFGKYFVVILLLFFAISSLYYLAPSKRQRFQFISAGSTLATVLCLFTSLGFNYYVNSFGRYNAVYGSIGTIIVIMMWFYLNSLALLIGFELNVSIRGAYRKRHPIKFIRKM